VPDIKKYTPLFKENFHMTPSDFDRLYSMVAAGLEPTTNTRPNDFVSPEEKLYITLEFLASVTLQRHLASV
jgi:hypothetical protein